jgi:hypothetical protein
MNAVVASHHVVGGGFNTMTNSRGDTGLAGVLGLFKV